MLTENEVAKLEAQCRAVPLTANEYVATDFVEALLETVMDYQNSTTTVQRAGKYFEAHAWNEARTLDDLEVVLARFPADKEGNDALAQYLWGYHHWRRAQELRGLVAYFRERPTPELALRSALYALGVRGWRIHVKGLPGKPDVAFGRWKVAVFVDGAFWHGHPSKFSLGRLSPDWEAKILGNQERDRRVDAELRRMGWRVLRLWDRDLKKDAVGQANKVRRALVARGYPDMSHSGRSR